MSASSKKKLRSETDATKLTERQLAEQKEAKKVKIYTIAFVVVLVIMVAVAVYAGINQTIVSSGIHEKNTVAATVGDHDISNAELSYYYMNAVNNFSSTYGSYAYLYGLDTSIPLDQQVIDEQTGETWADSFIQQAIANAQADYALADAAKAEGFVLPQDAQDQIDITIANLEGYASIYNYENAEAFLKAQYGNGASVESYTAYVERSMLANAYYNQHQEDLTYTDAQLREADSADPAAYNSYSYNQYYLAASRFLTGGTTDEEGNTTYTDEERQAAVEAAAEAAAAVTDESVTTVEEFDAAIAALAVNEGTSASSTAYNNQRYSSLNTNLSAWLADSARQAGDMTVVPNKSTSTDEDGHETETINGYYVAFFRETGTNETALVNARHILISFSGETNEDGTYTDEAKAAAKTTAEEILNEWKSGDATEESFAELATARSSDTGSTANGGLYENIYPGQMVTAFNDWCFDSSRKTGDTDIVETEYGYHIMYFVGTGELNYRDYMISSDLRSEDMQSWYTALIEGCPIVNGDTQYLRTNITLG